jgi:hypothetical protein
MNYMTQPLKEFIETRLRMQTNNGLKEMRAAALARQPDTSQSTTPGRDDLEGLIDRIEAEQDRRSNRTMLRIALVGLIVTGAAALADLVPKLCRWIPKLVKLAGL